LLRGKSDLPATRTESVATVVDGIKTVYFMYHCVNLMMSESVRDVDFTADIANFELLTAIQLIEQNIGNSLFAPVDFSDLPADTPKDVNLPCGYVSPSCAAAYEVEFSDISDAKLLQLCKLMNSSQLCVFDSQFLQLKWKILRARNLLSKRSTSRIGQ
jgi:hypothetical protein